MGLLPVYRSLMATCPTCGRQSERTSAFCRYCGSPLPQELTRHEQRKTVTILFCDLVHSTGLAAGDPETYRRVQARYFEQMRRIVERHGGTVEKFVGDEVMAVFGVPVAHEDDALRSVRAAKEMLAGLAAVNEELDPSLGLRLQARIGINTGEVLAGDPAEGHAFVAGEPVIIAKRLEQAAEASEILIGSATYPLVAHAVEAGPLERISVKGKEDQIGKHRVDDVRAEAPTLARRLNAPIVGRDEELKQLQRAFERAVEENCCRLFTLLGPPGIGKSRLATELLSWVDGRAVTSVGRCLSYGEGITFWPLAEALRGLGGEPPLREALSDDDQADAVVELLRGVTGTSETASSEQIFWAVRRAFEAVARRRPFVVCFEDLHWAEPTMLDLVEYIAGWIRDAPILVVAIARPELIEDRPHWIARQPGYETLTLGPLSRATTEALLAGLLAEAPLSPEVRDRIAAAAEGNPLFVEQMSAMAAEEGGELTIPPSIQALLAERLDRLNEEERQVIERASVVGRDFPVAAVASLLPDEQRGHLTPQLFALVRKEFIRPDPTPSAGGDRFSFQHVLVRDAAYEAIPKELRAALHEQLADWMDDSGSGREPDELLGYHLEQAYLYRHEVGLFDEHTTRLRARASEFLAAAGSRALGRNDVHAALKLLERAVTLRPEEDPAVGLRLDLAQALLLSGQLAAAYEASAETEGRASTSGDEAGALRGRLLGARIAAHMQREGVEGESPSAALLAVAEQARPVFARAGDELALVEAWVATAWAQLIRCRWAAMLEAVQRALEHARRAGSARWEGELPAWQGTAMFYGPTPVEEALRWYEEQQAQHPIALTQQAMLEAMRGNFDQARALAGSADAVAEEFGQKLWLAAGGMAIWEIEMLAGDASAAERAVRRSCELLEELGEVGYRFLAVGQLAASLLALERLEEADKWTRTAEELTPNDDVASQMFWRQVRAQVLGRRGEHEPAEKLGREAVSIAEETDMLNFHGNALADLAEVSILTGHVDDAREQLERALALYERKGNVVAGEKARRRLAEIQAGTPAAS
jgi:class 3 adenylate cyclase/tetratricopeptide (TPR) repeat protein